MRGGLRACLGGPRQKKENVRVLRCYPNKRGQAISFDTVGRTRSRDHTGQYTIQQRHAMSRAEAVLEADQEDYWWGSAGKENRGRPLGI